MEGKEEEWMDRSTKGYTPTIGKMLKFHWPQTCCGAQRSLYATSLFCSPLLFCSPPQRLPGVPAPTGSAGAQLPGGCSVQRKDTQCQKQGTLNVASQKNPASNSWSEFCLKLSCDLGHVFVIFPRKFCCFISYDNRNPGQYGHIIWLC